MSAPKKTGKRVAIIGGCGKPVGYAEALMVTCGRLGVLCKECSPKPIPGPDPTEQTAQAIYAAVERVADAEAEATMNGCTWTLAGRKQHYVSAIRAELQRVRPR